MRSKLLFTVTASILLTGLLFTGTFEQNAYAVNPWTPQVSGTIQSLNSLDFIDANNGIAVGGSGTILKTTDGGITWTPQVSGTIHDLLSLDFIDANNGIAVGRSGTILKTTDGGITWTPQVSVATQTLFFVDLVDANIGYVLGSSIFLKTTDGGITWIVLPTLNLNSLDFIDANNGIAVGGSGTILKTTDGGITWTPQVSGTIQSLNSVDFIDATTGYIVGFGNTILKTTDGGITWTPQVFGIPFLAISVDFIDANNGIAVGGGGRILKTTDGGITWTPQVSGTGNLLLSVDFVDSRIGYVVGGGGTILKSLIPCGLTNPNMAVSTENILSSNTFGGPMVTEVKICDSDIVDTSTAKGEPDVTVNGRILRMTQSIDGNWYGYFADRIQAQLADAIALNGPPGSSLDFGQFCKNTSSVLGIDVTDTNSIAIPVDVVNSGTQGTAPITVDCSGAITSTNTNNVVRESIPINPGSAIPTPPVEIGQIGLADAQFWPFIQLYEFTPTNDVFVQYNKGGGTQTTILTFDNADIFAGLVLDKPTYLPGDDVKATISDVQLNIDPTDEDSWTWATLSTGPALFYDLFDENGLSTGDTIQTISQDVFINLLGLMFEDNGKLFVEKSFAGTEILQLEDNNLHNLTPAINGATASGLISAIRQPVTFTEESSNSGTFVNFDSSGNSNINVRCDATPGFAGIIDYNETPLSILASGSCPTMDSDGDGIADSVDVNQLTPSFQFSDIPLGGTTFGSFIPGDQNILILDDANPNGVVISASSSGGVNPAIVSDCNNGANYSLSPGDIISLTCSSSDVIVIQGTVKVRYFVDGESFATTTLNTGDDVIFEQDSLTFTNNGFLPVTIKVNGKEIIINPLSVVEIFAPKQTKQNVLDQLAALEILSEDKKTDKRLEKAIESVKKSLDDKLWLDAFHLDSKKGKKIFENEKKAVKELQKILDKDDSINATLVQMAIDDLCEADKILAQTAIEDVNDTINKKIIEANKKMDKAQSEIDNNKCDKAIEEYQGAWKKAQDAVKKSDKNDDD